MSSVTVITPKRQTSRKRLSFGPRRKRAKYNVPRTLMLRTAVSQRGRNNSYFTGARNAGTLYTHQIGSNIVVGNERGDRHGDSVMLTGFRFNCQLIPTGTATAELGWLRVFIIKNIRSTVDADTRLWESRDNSNSPRDYAAADGILNITQPIATSQWKVMYDNVFPINILSTGETSPKSTFVNGFVRLKDKIQYNSDTDAVTKATPNIYFCYLLEKDQPDAGSWVNNIPTMRLNFGTYFRDI